MLKMPLACHGRPERRALAPLDRRAFLCLSAAQAGAEALIPYAWAQGRNSISLAFPTDVPTWDPNARVLAGAQSLSKCVFDSPLTQAPDLSGEPSFVKSWRYRDAASLARELELPDDAFFHNGHPVAAV